MLYAELILSQPWWQYMVKAGGWHLEASLDSLSEMLSHKSKTENKEKVRSMETRA